ncbi:MAG: hypothetical protein BWK77_03190 [Verrucomicrobia bacterium A1]|nr:MAG: hypothetical protein BWK77_03190 [Verrucomicrobia bacterium A1]
MTHTVFSVPVDLPVCPPTDEGSRDAQALFHILIAIGLAWAVAVVWRRLRARRPPSRLRP